MYGIEVALSVVTLPIVNLQAVVFVRPEQFLTSLFILDWLQENFKVPMN